MSKAKCDKCKHDFNPDEWYKDKCEELSTEIWCGTCNAGMPVWPPKKELK